MECWQYNPNVDYVAAIKRYNEFVNSGKDDEAIKIAKEFGGLIPLVANASKQRETTGNNK